jgi:TolB-like protein
MVCSFATQSQAATGSPGVCAPPRTVVAVVPFADQTGGAWQLMTGTSPANVVAARLADSLQQAHGRAVVIAPLAASTGASKAARIADDAALLAAARRVQAEVVLSGVVTSFEHEDRREPGRFGRWGMGAPDARSRAEVAVSIRVLDAHDGSVILESRAARERAGRSTASASAPVESGGVADLVQDDLIADALDQVLGDLVRTLAARLDARWQARVISEGRGIYVIDAGSGRGLFTGERLDVWRSGIELLDEDLLRLGDDVRTGAVVVVSIDGKGHARVRLAEGEVRPGDLVRPCSGGGDAAMSLRR